MALYQHWLYWPTFWRSLMSPIQDKVTTQWPLLILTVQVPGLRELLCQVATNGKWNWNMVFKMTSHFPRRDDWAWCPEWWETCMKGTAQSKAEDGGSRDLWNIGSTANVDLVPSCSNRIHAVNLGSILHDDNVVVNCFSNILEDLTKWLNNGLVLADRALIGGYVANKKAD